MNEINSKLQSTIDELEASKDAFRLFKSCQNEKAKRSRQRFDLLAYVNNLLMSTKKEERNWTDPVGIWLKDLFF